MSVLLAMSGGVDSCVAAHLLRDAGREVTGITLVFHPDVSVARCNLKVCCDAQDTLDAQSVCNAMGIPHFTLDLSETFHRKIILPFIDMYRLGETPNPCGRCNRLLKIGHLVEQLVDRGHRLSLDGFLGDHLGVGHLEFVDDVPFGRHLYLDIEVGHLRSKLPINFETKAGLDSDTIDKEGLILKVGKLEFVSSGFHLTDNIIAVEVGLCPEHGSHELNRDINDRFSSFLVRQLPLDLPCLRRHIERQQSKAHC